MARARFDHWAMSRRSFLALSGGLVLAACSRDGGDGARGARRATTSIPPGSTGPTTTLPPVPSLASDPFTLGVASGDPAADGFVLWTRLAPDPLIGGGMPPVEVPVRWMVGTDDALGDVAAEGTFVTGPDVAHTAHVVVEGLDPDRPYWYRFTVGDYETPIARTRTLPAPDRSPDRLRLGFASCQNYTDGFYTAWADVVAGDDLDLVVFVGDYIYESGLQGNVRAHQVAEVVSLDQYRNQYALYRSDPHLRAAHALAPWLVTWDDHEVENNYQGAFPEATSATPDPQQFLARRAAAYRAWWEHMPTRLAPPAGPDLRIYRGVDYGDLVRVSVLDTRQYRTDQSCSPSDIGAMCEAGLAPTATIIGEEQQSWLGTRLRDSSAIWDVIAQQVVFSRLGFTPGPEAIFNLDQWDGYPGSREAVLAMLREAGTANPVVLTGDIHASGVSDIKADYEDPASATIGAELVGTSISSDAAAVLVQAAPLALAANPHVRWADASKRGWVRCEITRDAWRADYRLVDDALVEGSAVTTATSWILEPGRPVEQI